MSSRPVLVTGGTGFIGRHLIERLLDDGEDIVMLTRPSSIVHETITGRVEHVECASGWSQENLEIALKDYDFSLIYHLASYGVLPGNRNIMPMLEINASLPATLVLLAAERNAGMVMTGTCAEYMKPDSENPLAEKAPLEMNKLYGTSKAAGGLLASAAAQQVAVNLRVLRLFNVYGPGEAPHRLLPSLWSNLRAGEHVPLSEGTQVRDFVYIKDVVESVVQAGNSICNDEHEYFTTIWNVCTGSGSTVRSFARKMASLMEVPSDLLGFGDVPIREDEVPWLVGAPDRIQSELGWKAEYDLESGLQHALEAMSEN